MDIHDRLTSWVSVPIHPAVLQLVSMTTLKHIGPRYIDTWTTYTCTLTYIYTYTHTYIATYIHTYIATYIHTYIATYIHTYIATYIATYIHT